MKRIGTYKDGDYTFYLEVQDSRYLIPERLDKALPKGITAFWTVYNDRGEVVAGLPVTNPEYQIMAFATEAEAEIAARKFMRF